MLIRNLVDIWTMSMVRTALLQGRLDGQLNVGRPTCALHGGQWEILCRSRLDDTEQVRLSALRERAVVLPLPVGTILRYAWIGWAIERRM